MSLHYPHAHPPAPGQQIEVAPGDLLWPRHARAGAGATGIAFDQGSLLGKPAFQVIGFHWVGVLFIQKKKRSGEHAMREV